MTRLLFIAATLLNSAAFAQSVVWDTTFAVKSAEFQIIAGRDQNEDVYSHLIKNQSDTTTVIGAAGGIEVRDFNLDGYSDVFFSYLGNVLVYDLFLFDDQQESFRKVDGFENVSYSKPVDGHSDIYYSYQRAGCADANWISWLFEIRDYKVHELGEIEGNGCESGGQSQGITVYKIVTLDKIFPIDNFPIDTIEGYDEYKWGFIADYWKNNLGKF